MPIEIERALEGSADKRGMTGEEKDRFVYGTLRKRFGWKPRREIDNKRKNKTTTAMSRLDRLIELNAKAKKLVEFGLMGATPGKLARRVPGSSPGLGPIYWPKEAQDLIWKSRPGGPPKRAFDPKTGKMMWSVKAIKRFSSEPGDLVEFDYEDERNNTFMRDAILGAGGATSAGLGGLYLRNRGDELNKLRHEAIMKHRALAPGEAGMAMPTWEQYRGSNLRGIKTGAGDLLSRIKGKTGNLKPLLEKLGLTRLSSRYERLVQLNQKFKNTVELGIGDVAASTAATGGLLAGGYYLHQRGAELPLSALEKKRYAYKSLAPHLSPGRRPLGANLRVGASDILKSLAKRIR